MSKVNFTKVYSLEDVKRARTDVFLQEEIIKQFYPLIKSRASKFITDVALFDFDDRIQIGMLCVVKAINDYDGSILFSSHVNNKINNGFMNENKKYKTEKHFGGSHVKGSNGTYEKINVVSLQLPTRAGDGKGLKEIKVEDEVEDKTTSIISCMVRSDNWSEILKFLNDKEKHCMEQMYIHEKNMTEIGKEMGVSPQRVNYLIKNSYHKLFKIFESSNKLEEFLFNF